MKIKVPCVCTKTKGKARQSLWRGKMFFNDYPRPFNPDHYTACPYCKGTLKQTKTVPNKSHRMGRWRTEVRSPAGTPRFYRVRNCTKCGGEEMEHAAGHFFEGLLVRCPGKRSND